MSLREHESDDMAKNLRSARRHPWRYLVGTSLLAIVVIMAALYTQLSGNLSSIDLEEIGADRPMDTGALDVLVLGSDSRSGANAQYGADVEGARSDTAMLVHVSKDRQRASVVSIPRDMMVKAPACAYTPNDDQTNEVMFNSTLAVGGPKCAVQTTEKLTGIHIDHFIEIDFDGFKKIVDAIGGVEMNFPEAMADEMSGLRVHAGKNLLGGDQALALVRTRYGFHDGSDIGRISLQHEFLRAMSTKAYSQMHNPVQLYQLLNVATSSMTTDKGLASLRMLGALAQELHAVPQSNIEYLTMPNKQNAYDPNRLSPKQPEANQLWQRLR